MCLCMFVYVLFELLFVCTACMIYIIIIITDLGYKLSSFSGEERVSSFLFQRLSVSLQRFNSVLLHDTFMIDDVPDQ